MESVPTLKSVLELQQNVYCLQRDLDKIQQHVRLLLCSNTKARKGDGNWDFAVLSKSLNDVSLTVKEQRVDLIDVKNRLGVIEEQFLFVVQDDVLNYKDLMKKWDSAETIINSHTESLKILSERISLVDFEGIELSIEELAKNFEPLESIPEKVEHLEQVITTSINGVEEMTLNIINSNVDIKDLRRKLEILAEVRVDVSELQSIVQIVDNKIPKLEEEAHEATSQISSIQTRAALLENAIEELRCELRDVREKNYEQDRRLDSVEEAICKIEAILDILETKVESILSKDYDTQLDNIRDNIKNIDSELVNVNKRADVMQEVLKSQQEQIKILNKNVQALLDNRCAPWPIGTIYMTLDDVNPKESLGCGTWVKIHEKFLFGASDKYPVESKGGEFEHILTIDEMPKHTHIFPALSEVADSYKYELAVNSQAYTYKTGCACYEINDVLIDNIKHRFVESGKELDCTSGIIPFSAIPKGSRNVEIWIDSYGADDDIQLFTMDGHHLLGTPLSDKVWSYNNLNIGNVNDDFITTKHGFQLNSKYTVPDDMTSLVGEFNTGSTSHNGQLVHVGDESLINKTVKYYRHFDPTVAMYIDYSGDFNSTGNNVEYIKIDRAIEDILVFVLGSGVFKIKAVWEHIPDIVYGSFGIDVDYNQYHTTKTGETMPHNNMPPYLAVYIWKRVI